MGLLTTGTERGHRFKKYISSNQIILKKSTKPMKQTSGSLKKHLKTLTLKNTKRLP